MTHQLSYEWRLREQMAAVGMFSTTKLIPLLAERGITLSASQVYRLVAERPERLNLQVLVALTDILRCTSGRTSYSAGTMVRRTKQRCRRRPLTRPSTRATDSRSSLPSSTASAFTASRHSRSAHSSSATTTQVSGWAQSTFVCPTLLARGWRQSGQGSQ
ncbi:helix-turn-helix transcriptional regulator [Curtobacterium sp. B8]|uniref:helix-turn-helix domain-containing protein n=1 Tax=Curtobacterium sp. B8 TaxID=95611 RepID=UPI0016519876|nr:helix-turn-helix transcriptional regulator [Curtobacterium sp. B8]